MHSGAAQVDLRGVSMRLFRRVRRGSAAEPVTAMMPLPPDDKTVHRVLDIALRIGELQMAAGAGAADVTATMLEVAAAFELSHCEVDVIFTSITIACHRGPEAAPVASIRVVRARSLDYTRLINVERLVYDITQGKIGHEEAMDRLAEIDRTPHPYPRWVATAAWGGMAAFITLLIGGKDLWPMAIFAAAITMVVDRFGRQLNKRALPFFFQQAVGGALATGAAIAVVERGWLPIPGQPRISLVVAAAITVLLSGLTVVATVQDAISGYNVTAAGRTVEVFLLTAGLITGVTFALRVAHWVGMAAGPIAEPLPPSALDLPLQTVAGAGAAGCFAMASYAPWRALLVSFGVGGLGAASFKALTLAELEPISASALAAMVIGFVGGLISRQLKLPPLIAAVSGLMPLFPGLGIYRGLYELAVLRDYQGLGTLMVAAAIAVALASGVVFGEYLAQPVRTRLGRLERRLSGPRMAGPMEPVARELD
ncbi:threonine/serine exporter family protein [Pseudonocardiaceae bacterium YIM PH 21723]|nr:threonine/serine exporter family protein [Pseudonocardiaceae bacterium YIM PH 21723]